MTPSDETHEHGPRERRDRGPSLVGRLQGLRERFRGSSLARGTWFMFLGLTARAGIQAVYFIVIARALAAEGYGAFVGVLALSAVAVPFASWGTGQMLIQDVSRQPDLFARRWGQALVVTITSGLALGTLVTAASRLVLPASIPLALVVMIALSELLFARFTDVASQAFWAFGKLQRTAVISVWLVVVRLIAALALVALVENPTALDWGVGYVLSSAVAAVGALALVQRELGSPDFRRSGERPRFREGFYFSLGQSAGGVYNDIDKTMLARLSTLEAAGVYGAAYRILDVAFAPVLSLLMASYPQFFKSGAAGVGSALKLARRLLPVGSAYGAATGVALFFSAPLIPLLLGEGYADTVSAIRWLALLPLLRAVQYLGADILTGAGRQPLRSALYLGTAGANILLNLWLIPRYSWMGAAWASLISDAGLALAVWISVMWVHQAERGGAAEAAAVLAPGVE